jgi:hypothetical protein
MEMRKGKSEREKIAERRYEERSESLVKNASCIMRKSCGE